MKNEFTSFNNLIVGQFKYGGEKYKSTSKKEATDELFDSHSYRGLMFTIDKYTYRFKNLERERDLLKIAAYMYILWLKRGYHLGRVASSEPINTTVEVKSRYFDDFILSAYAYYGQNTFYVETLSDDDARQKISNVLKSFSAGEWNDVSEDKLLHIYALAFVIWNNKYFLTGTAGKDTDTYNETAKLESRLLESTKEYFQGSTFQLSDDDIKNLVQCQLRGLTQKGN